MKSLRTFCLLLLTGIMGVSGIGAIFFTGPEVVFKEKVISSSSGNPIRIFCVFPGFEETPKENSHPAVIAIPPYNVPPEAIKIICIELARRGVACAVPNFFGKTQAESRQKMGKDSLRVMTRDVLSIAKSLKAIPWVDPERLGMYGHSVGGTVAFLAGLEDSSIKAVVLIGMEAEVYPQRPQNLLFLAGFYDEMRTPVALLKRFEEHGISTNPEINILYGDFDQGIARQITIVPTCEHFIETFDLLLIQHLLQWYGRAFDMPELGQGILREWWRRVTAFVFMLSTTVVYIMLMVKFLSNLSPKLASQFPLWLDLRIQFFPLLVLLSVLWISGRELDDFRLIATDLMVSLLLAHLVISVWVRRKLEPNKHPAFHSLCSVGFIILALGVAMLITWFMTSLSLYFRFPTMILWYPVFVINVSVLFPLQLWGRMVPWLFADVIDGFSPNGLYVALFCVILVFLDKPVRLLNRISKEFIASLTILFKPPDQKLIRGEREQTGKKKVNFSMGKIIGIAQLSPIKIVLLSGLWSILAFLLYRRIAEGMLTIEVAKLGAFILLRLVIVPFLIMWLIIRNRVFRRISGIDKVTKSRC